MSANKVVILNTSLIIEEFVKENPQYTFSAKDDVLSNGKGCWAFVFLNDETGKIHLTAERHVPDDMLFELLTKYGGEYYESEYDTEPDRTFMTQAEINNVIKNRVDELLNGSETRFAYMMLDRMRSDCEYYLGYGNRYAKHLWAADERLHIAYMKEIWNRFPEDGKPEWLPFEKILDYEKQMCGPVKKQSVDSLIADASERIVDEMIAADAERINLAPSQECGKDFDI